MINKVLLNSLPAFREGGHELGPLTHVNFIFGANGSGKTSISQLLADSGNGTESAILWEHEKLPIKVFNKHYVEGTFIPDEFPGVFVLGPANIAAQENRKKLKLGKDKTEQRINELVLELGKENDGSGEMGKRDKLTSDFQDDIWKLKSGFEIHFPELFHTYRSSKLKLFEKVKAVRAIPRNAEKDLDELKVRAVAVFDKSAESTELISTPRTSDLVASLQSKPWGQALKGSSDSELSALIMKLDNSDWVREGCLFLGDSEGTCPFCQQETPTRLSEALSQYFDSNYDGALKDLESEGQVITQSIAQVSAALQAIRAQETNFPKAVELGILAAQLDLEFEKVAVTVNEKIANPSKRVTFPSIAELLDKLATEVSHLNSEIAARNLDIERRETMKGELLKEFWNYFVWVVIDKAFSIYESRISPVELRIQEIDSEIKQLRAQLTDISLDLTAITEGFTSNELAIQDINNSLKVAGFNSFSLANADDLPNGFKLVRLDGENARKTLSEGERSFVSFLYFMHEIQGVDPGTGSQEDCVVVIDDPVTSMDSDSMFFTTTWIRDALGQIKRKEGNIRQLVVLTHNVYFHHELTYRVVDKGFEFGFGKESRAFFLIRKGNSGQHRVESHEDNPVTSTYEMFWREVREADKNDQMPVGLRNTMRRILETYFSFTNLISVSKIPLELDAEDQKIARVLLSSLNAGSHKTELHSDLYVSEDLDSAARYLKIFKLIFEKTGNIAHHEAMING